MRTKLLSSLPAVVVFLAASQGGPALAQTYTFSNLYPTNVTGVLQNSTVACHGTLMITQGATAPTDVLVTITDKNGNKYTGQAGVQRNGNLSYTFQAAVTIPASAATGQATCLFQYSTNNGAPGSW